MTGGSRPVRLLVGSYTEPRPNRRIAGKGVALLRLHPDSGALETLDLLGGLPNPAYLRPHRETVAHVACEEDAGAAGIATVGIDGDRLALLARAAVPGDAPCHLDVHPGGRWLATACYGSGHVCVHPLDAGGQAGEPVAVVQHHGAGTHPVRQAGPHAHATRFSPDGRWLLAADLGTDEVWCHPFDAATGLLGPAPRRWRAPAGSGPRLLLFARDGRHVVLVNELANTVASLRWENGALSPVAAHPTLLRPHGGANTASGLRWHPSGTGFAASNRGAESIALFGFDPATGAVEPVSETPAGCAKPRDFDFSPCGRWLVVCGQDSDELAVLAVDPARLSLLDTGIRHRMDTPSCLRFLPEGTP